MDEIYARVSFQYTATNAEEISANEGDIIKVTSQYNEHWYNSELNNYTGLFPISYTISINSPLQNDIFVATETYLATKPNELSFSRGDRVKIIEVVDNHWWRGEIDGKIGILPNNYVEKLYESVCDNSDFYVNLGINEGCDSVEALYTFTARNSEELSFPQGAIITIVKDVDDDWYEGIYEGQSGLFPKSYVQPFQDIYEVPPTPCARSIYPFVGESESELTFKEGEIILLHNRAGSQWLEGEIDGVVGLFPASFVDIEIDLPPELEENKKLTQKVPLKEGLRMRALYHFSALHPGDLALNEGDIVTIVKILDDNWIEGRVSSGVSGMCPSAYLVPIDKESIHHTNGSSGSNSLCDQLKAGILARDQSYSRADSSSVSSIDESSRGEDSTDSVFFTSRRYWDGKTSFNKAKPAPKPPQSKSDSDNYFNSNAVGNRSLSQSYPRQDECKSASSIKSSIYAIPFKSSQSRVTQFRGKSTSSIDITTSSDSGTSSIDITTSSDSGNCHSNTGTNSGRSLIDMSVSNRASSFNLASPLLPLPYKNSQSDNLEEPIVPKRKAPLPPRKSLSDNTVPPERAMSNNPPLIPRKADAPLPPRKTKSDTPLPPEKTMSDAHWPPRTGRTKANVPPPPRRSMSDQKSVTLPRTELKGRGLISSEKGSEKYGSSSSIGSGGSSSSLEKSSNLKPATSLETSHKKRPPPPPTRYNKDKFSGFTRSATISTFSRDSFKKDKQFDNRPTQSRPYSVYYVGEDKKDDYKLEKASSLEEIRQTSTLNSVKKVDYTQDEEDSNDVVDDLDVALIPGVAELDKKIANAEHNLQVEWRACTGMKTILQMLVHDVDKHKEMEGKISRSQQKIEEWKDISNGLKNEKSYLIQSYPKRKRIQDSIALLEADLQKQLRSQKSLQVLLGVVEESRKEEVLDNIKLCDNIINDLQSNIAARKESLQNINPPKTSKSAQKQFAEQRQKVVNELIHTEQDYLRDLQLCLKYFAQELKNSKIVESDVLFGNMNSVVDTSSKLLASFEDAVKGKEADDQELGKCFVDIAHEIKDVYSQYCRNHDDAIGLLEKYEDVPEAQEAFNKCLNAIRDSTKCWDLSSFLIKPVQRVLKYPLLLSELLKCTPEIHKDKQNLIKAMSVMNDVAAEINEVKRRKDIVLKYKRVEESGISKTFQKLNWHSVLKKSSRFNQRITQMTGLVSQTVDKKFIEHEKKFILLEKAVKNLIKNITSYIDQFQETRTLQCDNGNNIQNFYQDAATCTEVTLYQSTLRRINGELLDTFMDEVQRLVLCPLTSLLALFQGPQRLIQKRQDKCLDYDSRSNRIEKIKDKDKLRTAKSELESAKKDYEALNTQLLEELPVFHDKTISLIKDCILNLIQSKRNFHAVFLGEYTNLLLLPMVKDEGDIIEQQTRKMQMVVEQMADLSFIPLQFLGKELMKKRREARKQPLIPSLPASTGDVVSGQKGKPSRTASLSRKRMAPQPPHQSGASNVARNQGNQERPKPAPRRVTSPIIPQTTSSIEITASNFEPYVAISTFQAQNPGELTMCEGDLVTVQRQSDTSGNSEWWLVTSSSSSGYVPSSFLEKYAEFEDQDDEEDQSDDGDGDDDDNSINNTSIQDMESDLNTSYYAQFEFEGTSEFELSLDEGQMVTVQRFHDLQGNDEWWLVEAGGKQGYVAANFLAPVEDTQ